VSWTFSDRWSNIRANVIQQGLQDMRKHAGARYLEVVASKSEAVGREDNFQYKKIRPRSPKVQKLSDTLFGMLSSRISDRDISA